MDYLVCHNSAENFALVGHSTGCQNSIHLLKYGRKDAVERVKVCVYMFAILFDVVGDTTHIGIYIYSHF